jgi:hypothetical protein
MRHPFHPRLRRRAPDEAAAPAGAGDRDRHEDLGQHLVAWGLQPSQWRTTGTRVRPPQQAVLLWRQRDEPAMSEGSLRARRAYDALVERGAPVRADATQRGIEVVLPLAAVATHLRLLSEWSILPDAILVAASAAATEVEAVFAEKKRIPTPIEVEVGEPLEDGWITELRQAARLEP